MIAHDRPFQGLCHTSGTCSEPVTVNYRIRRVPVFPKYRGKQVLMRDENGLEKCVACGLCSVACPADAIYLGAAENDGTVMAGPRYASIYQIHKTRCIFCGMCEEACPGVGDLHGQGLRARRLQQGRLHLGQG
jgi:NADH-quinone oxidoreductase subunit I